MVCYFFHVFVQTYTKRLNNGDCFSQKQSSLLLKRKKGMNQKESDADKSSKTLKAMQTGFLVVKQSTKTRLYRIVHLLKNACL